MHPLNQISLLLPSLSPFALALSVMASVSPAQPQASGLRPLAARQMLTLGAAVPAQVLKDDIDKGQFREALVSNFNLIELENDFKPPAIWTAPRTYNFENTDFVLGAPGQEGWAQKHQMKVRGHVLVYASDGGYTLPNWIRAEGDKLSKEEASQLLHDYIKAVAGRYKGKIVMWDVVNEAIDDRPNKNPFNLRDSFWFRKLGPEFLVLAFKWAREADPRAELYYNEYGIEGGGTKGQHLLDMVKWLKEQGAPITGVGLQYHLDCKAKVEPGSGYYQYLKDIEKLGLDHMVTELDVAVPVQEFPANDPKRGMVPKDPADFENQAKVYADVFRMAMSMQKCRGINIWGLSDAHSWIPGFSRGKNGVALILDANYKPKPAYNAIKGVLER